MGGEETERIREKVRPNEGDHGHPMGHFSETRLIEIMENACSRTESQVGRNDLSRPIFIPQCFQCTTFLEKYEEPIEEWYQTSSPESLENFYQWLCIDTAKVCCPEGTFGKNCRRCQYGDNGRVCSGNGVCDVS